MINRRIFIKYSLATTSIFAIIFTRIGGGVRYLLAETKRRILERGTPMSKLMHANPARVDIRNLDTTPISDFDVMGETTLEVDIDKYRLRIEGAVSKPMEFSYEELVKRQTLERHALLVCPGFFAFNGLWRGISVATLLREAGYHSGAKKILFSGSEGWRKKSRRFPIDEVLADKIFIAYMVNGQTLPQRHGYPLRLVADDHKGRRWIKYVNLIQVLD